MIFNMISGLDTSDATAAAEDIESGKTAYVNGEKVTGTIPKTAVQVTVTPKFEGTAPISGRITMSYAAANSKRIIGGGTGFSLGTDAANMGDAAASDVASGKTFTSAAGLLVTGTREDSAGGIYMAQVTPETDSEALTIQHNLGTTDILLAAAFAETLGGMTPTFNGALAHFWAKTDIPVRVTSTSFDVGYDSYFSYSTDTTWALGGAPTSTVYRCGVVDENTFKFARGGSAAARYIAGVTYTVIIIAANGEVS